MMKARKIACAVVSGALLAGLLCSVARAAPPPQRLQGAYHGYVWWQTHGFDSGPGWDSLDVTITETNSAIRLRGYTLPVSGTPVAVVMPGYGPCDTTVSIPGEYLPPDTTGQHYPAVVRHGAAMTWGYGAWRHGSFDYNYFIDPCAFPASGDTVRGYVYCDAMSPWGPPARLPGEYGYEANIGSTVGQWWATRTLFVGPAQPPPAPIPQAEPGRTEPTLAERP